MRPGSDLDEVTAREVRLHSRVDEGRARLAVAELPVGVVSQAEHVSGSYDARELAIPLSRADRAGVESEANRIGRVRDRRRVRQLERGVVAPAFGIAAPSHAGVAPPCRQINCRPSTCSRGWGRSIRGRAVTELATAVGAPALERTPAATAVVVADRDIGPADIHIDGEGKGRGAGRRDGDQDALVVLDGTPGSRREVNGE